MNFKTIALTWLEKFAALVVGYVVRAEPFLVRVLTLLTIRLDGEVVGDTVVVVEMLHEFVVIALSFVGEQVDVEENESTVVDVSYGGGSVRRRVVKTTTAMNSEHRGVLGVSAIVRVVVEREIVGHIDVGVLNRELAVLLLLLLTAALGIFASTNQTIKPVR